MRHLLALCLLLFLPLAAAAQDASTQEADKGFLTDLITKNLSGAGREVQIYGFAGALSSKATIDRLTVADGDGVWLTLENVALTWDRLALFGGKIEIQELSAGKIDLARMPKSPASAPAPEAAPFQLPNLPVAINIDALHADDIALGPTILGEAVDFSLDGNVNLAGGEGAAKITANRLGDKTGTFDVDASYANATNILGLNLSLEEGADGIVARLLNLPGAPSLKLAVQGTGPIPQYGANLTLDTDGQRRMEGSFKLTTTAPDATDPNAPAAQTRTYHLDLGGDVTTLFLPAYRDFFGPSVQLVVDATQRPDGGVNLSQLNLAAASLKLQGDASIGPGGWPEAFRLTGTIASADGAPALLPVPGGSTTLQSAAIKVLYDNASGNGWTADVQAKDFTRPGLTIPELSLTGGGIIEQGASGGAGRFTGDLTYAARGLRFGDVAVATALGDTLQGDLKILHDENRPTRIETFTLNGAGISANATATVQGPETGLQTDFTLGLAASALDRFSTLAGRRLGGAVTVNVDGTVAPLNGTVDATVNAETEDLVVDVAQVDPLMAGKGTLAFKVARDTAGSRITDLALNTPAARANGALQLTSTAASATLDAALTDIGLIVPELSGPATVTANATRNAAGVIDLTARAGLAGDTADLTAQKPADDSPITLDLTAAAGDLSRFAALARRPLAGSVQGHVSGTLKTDLSTVDLTLALATRDVATGIAKVDPLLKGAGTVQGQVRRDGDAYAVKGFRVRTPELTLDADSDLTGTTLEDLVGTLNLNGSVSDLGLIQPGVQGPAQVVARGVRDDTGKTSLFARANASGATAEITASSPAATQPIAVNLTADVPDLGPVGKLIGRPLGGGISGRVQGTLMPDLKTYDLTLTATTRSPVTGIAQLDPLLQGAGTLKAEVSGDGPAYAVKGLEVQTNALRLTGSTNFSGTTLDTITGQFDVNGAITNLSLVQAGLSGPASLTAQGARDPAGKIDLTARARAAGGVIDLTASAPDVQQPVAIDLATDLPSLRPFGVLAGQDLSGALKASLKGTAMLDGSRFDITVSARSQDLGIGNPTIDKLTAGAGEVDGRVSRTGAGGLAVQGLTVKTPQLSLTGSLSGNDGAGRAQFDARLADIGLLAPDFSGPLTATGTADRSTAGDWTVKADATGPGGTQASVRGTVSAATTLALTITGQAPLGLLNGIVEPQRLTGTVAANLTVNGPPALSSVSGTIRTDNANLSLPTLQQSLSGVSGTIRLGGGTAQVALAGNGANGGRITVAGPVTLSGGYGANLSVALSQVVVKDPNLYSATVNGSIGIDGALTGGAAITGQIDLGPVDVQVPSSSVGALGDLPDVRHVGASSAVQRTLNRAGLTLNGTPPAAAASGGSSARAGYPLNLIIRAPGRIFVRGRGLDAELGGTLRIAGTSNAPIPSGQFSLIRGRLSILQQNFDLSEGTITLAGDFTPTILLIATTTARTGTSVTITVQGPATEPQVTFSSSPELPQDEVISQLIFGRDLASISPLQAVQLAAAVGTLAGRGGNGVVDQLRQGLGLDDFQVTTDNNGNVAVQAGKYISKNVYTDVTVNGDGTTDISINLDVTPSITAKGSAGSDGSTSVGLFYERDY